MTHDFLSIYGAKGMEYVLAVTYLLLFIPFWRYVQGGKKVEAAIAVELKKPAADLLRAPARPAGATALRPTAGWFHVPAGVHLHPGHTWARLDADGLVSVGVDDFAANLFRRGVIVVGDDHGHTRCGHAMGDGPADAVTTPADQSDWVQFISPPDVGA